MLVTCEGKVIAVCCGCGHVLHIKGEVRVKVIGLSSSVASLAYVCCGFLHKRENRLSLKSWVYSGRLVSLRRTRLFQDTNAAPESLLIITYLLKRPSYSIKYSRQRGIRLFDFEKKLRKNTFSMCMFCISLTSLILKCCMNSIYIH